MTRAPRRVRPGSRSVPAGCLPVTYSGPARRDGKPRAGGQWGREVRSEGGAAGACACCRGRACACVCACALVLPKEGSAAGRVRYFPRASVSPAAGLPPSPASLAPRFSPASPAWRGFQGTGALPSHPSGFCCIPVSHSPNKPLRAKERREAGEGERGGWMQTQPRLLPLSCSHLVILDAPSHAHMRPIL